MSGTIYIYANGEIVDHVDFQDQAELLWWLQQPDSQDKVYSVSFD